MSAPTPFEIFLAGPPGFEAVLCDEAVEQGFVGAKAVSGGVVFQGGWPDVWRANLELRGANRVMARFAAFHVTHLAKLDKQARRLPWAQLLRRDVPVHVEATCKRSRIYHSGAAAERIATAIRDELGAEISGAAPVTIMLRLEDDLCTISVDTSGELLHKRGFKEAVNKAPMRETMAALFLRQCGYDGHEPVVDPMCGSGTFVIEAAEIAAGLKPGRARAFAFEHIMTFDSKAWTALRATASPREHGLRFYGSDRDTGAIAMSEANAARAGVSASTSFRELAIRDLARPDGPPGLVILNPPYGDRIGDKSKLSGLYRTIGQTLMERFGGWRAAIITSDAGLARATRLPFVRPSAPVPHGGLRVTLYQTGPLL
jgi:putative N6-adenine-specific DNA methylase